MRKILLLILLIMLMNSGFSQNDSVVNTNIEIFSSYLKKLNSDYVDKINITKLVHKGIDAMNQSLDPFTVFSDEEEVKARRNGWKGYMFSGIGAGVAPLDSCVIITELYRDCPAQLAGLRIGDRIIEINSYPVTGKTLGEVVSLLKGEDGSGIVIKVSRPGVGNLLFALIRKKIIARSVNYYGMINDSIGYIKCSQFLENSYDSMRVALASLEKNKKFSCLIFDLRDNTGGLAQDAVNTVNLFLPKGKLVCSLKSTNNPESKYDYITQYDPVDTNVRIVVLSSGITVSAGEIVCAALQDYDRAVIIGQRTYGKGYVQGTRQLANNTELYLTAARYYTPSGRCIQEIDYTHKYLDGTVGKLKDSSVYYTKNHRKVEASAGVSPDVKLDLAAAWPESVSMLVSNSVIRDFAVSYRNTHETYPDFATFKLSENDYNNFYKTALKKIITLNNSSEAEIVNFESLLQKDSINRECIKEINKLKAKIKKQKIAELKNNTPLLKSLLEREILICYYNSEGQMKYTFYYSTEVQKAIEIFKNNYQKILNP